MERFGRYVLIERVAHGGMAEVFRAASVGTEGFAKLLAVKRILPHLAAEKAFVTMLVDEAKIAATLNHPNIVQVLDLGRVGDVYFIAMEFVAGQALNHVIASAIRQSYRLPPEFAFHVVGQALRGLGYAHQKTDPMGRPMSIIHRDVSPQNIMVAYDGAVRLADFGIAKAAERSTQTLTGSLKGKPAYMAPEQVQQAGFDQRADLYAMGVVLHELISMRRMRKAQTDVQLLLDVAKGEFPTFEQLGVQVAPDAAEVVYRALDPDPDSRWQTAAEFADACDAVARVHHWHFSQVQVSETMRRLFAAEMDHERQAQEHFQGIVADLASASTGEVSAIVRRASSDNVPRASTSDAPTLVTPPLGAASDTTRPTLAPPAATPARANTLLIVALMALVGALAGVGVLLWTTREPAPRPVAERGQLIIQTQPPGARITVAGRVLPGVTPVVAENLPPGPVEVTAALKGMAPAKDVAMVRAGGAERLTFNLQPATAQVRITTVPPGANVLVNGRSAGDSPLTVTLTGPEDAVIRAQLAGRAPAQEIVAVDSAPGALELVLPARDDPPKPARDDDRRKPGKDRKDKPDRPDERGDGETNTPSGGEGQLTLQSRPWARIFIDGKDTGRFTPAAEMPLSAGKHTIKLVNDEENLSTTFTLTIKPGENLNLTRELH